MAVVLVVASKLTTGTHFEHLIDVVLYAKQVLVAVTYLTLGPLLGIYIEIMMVTSVDTQALDRAVLSTQGKQCGSIFGHLLTVEILT